MRCTGQPNYAGAAKSRQTGAETRHAVASPLPLCLVNLAACAPLLHTRTRLHCQTTQRQRAELAPRCMAA